MTALFFLIAGFFTFAIPNIIAAREGRRALSSLDGMVAAGGILIGAAAVFAVLAEWLQANVAR